MRKLIKKILKEDFDWADNVPYEKSISEIKQLRDGFRELFEVGDILVVTGSIPCESIRDGDCVINLSNHEFRVSNVYRTRIEIVALDDEMISQFMDEWGQDSVWLGVESSDDDITLHKKNNINEDFDWADDIPGSMEPGDLIPGNNYKITWDDDEWLGAFNGRGIRSGDTFKYLRGNDDYYYFEHPKAFHEIAVPLDYDNEFPDGWGPRKYGIVVLPTDRKLNGPQI